MRYHVRAESREGWRLSRRTRGDCWEYVWRPFTLSTHETLEAAVDASARPCPCKPTPREVAECLTCGHTNLGYLDVDATYQTSLLGPNEVNEHRAAGHDVRELKGGTSEQAHQLVSTQDRRKMRVQAWSAAG